MFKFKPFGVADILWLFNRPAESFIAAVVTVCVYYFVSYSLCLHTFSLFANEKVLQQLLERSTVIYNCYPNTILCFLEEEVSLGRIRCFPF